jgi:hypothetical protein
LQNIRSIKLSLDALSDAELVRAVLDFRNKKIKKIKIIEQ